MKLADQVDEQSGLETKHLVYGPSCRED
jgi:hypothetical protein